MEKLTVLNVSSPQNSCGCCDCNCPSIGFIYARAENGRVWCYSFDGEAPFVEGVTVLDPLDDDSHWFLVDDDEVPPSLQRAGWIFGNA